MFQGGTCPQGERFGGALSLPVEEGLVYGVLPSPLVCWPGGAFCLLVLLPQVSPGRGTAPCPTLPTSAHCSPPPPAHMDSEAEGRSCASAGGHPSSMARGPASPPPSPETPSPTPLSPDLPSLDPARCDLLGSRLERE